MRDIIKRYRKAIAGAIAGGAAALIAALDHGTIAGDEWISIVVGIIVGAGGVAVAPANAQKRGERRADRA